MASVLVLNGPNMNLLGEREPGHYGERSLADIVADMEAFGEACGVDLEHIQSNSEGDLVDAIQRAAKDGVDYIIFRDDSGAAIGFSDMASSRTC